MIPELHLQYKYDQNSPYHNLFLDDHTKIVVKNVEGLINRWAALLHDIAKPFCRTDKLLGELDINNMKIKSNYPKHDLLGCEMVKRLGRNLK